jgi:predicted anti-sigma-YlaC factor YlaD
VKPAGTGNCDDVKPLLMGYLDGELDSATKQLVEEHVAACPRCARELEDFGKLQEVMSTMKFKEPIDAELDRYWRNVYNRLERGIGWILFSIGAIIMLCYGGFKLVEEVVRSPSLSIFLKIGVVALVFGVVILFVSIARERLQVCAKDKYSREVER